MGNSDLPDLRLGEAARRTGGPARSSRHGGRNYADDSTSGLADARQQRAPKTYGSRLRGQQRLPRSRYIKISGCRYAPAALRGQPERVPGSAAGTIDPRAARRQRKPSGNPHLRVRFAEGSSKNTPPHTSDFSHPRPSLSPSASRSASSHFSLPGDTSFCAKANRPAFCTRGFSNGAASLKP